jgi:ATPase subunit of ABC transporter with duplicated ATPase domains
MKEISKEEFLKACQSKIAQDEARRREEERRRKAEEERKRKEEEERRRKAEEERKKREAEEKRKRDFDAWVNNLPIECQGGFVFNGFQYSIDTNARKVFKTPVLGDPRGRLGDSRFSGASSVNQELGI